MRQHDVSLFERPASVSRTLGRRVSRLAVLAAIALLIVACGDDDNATIESNVSQATVTLAPIDWLTQLPPPPSYSDLSDDQISDLLSRMRTTRMAGDDEPPILIPQFLAGSELLAQEAPSDILERIRSLFGEAGSREQGAAITGADADCLDLDGDGECDRLSLRFRCDRCSDTRVIDPMVFEAGDDGEWVPTVEGYAERLARDLDEDAVLVLNDNFDEATRRAFQRLSQSQQFGVVDDLVSWLPTGKTCIKVPKGPKLCFLR